MIWTGRALRGLAVLIVIAGVIDPVFSWSGAARPLVGIVDAGAPALTAELARELAGDFDVHVGAIAGAAATVLTGDAVPNAVAASGALIAVTPALVRPRVEINRMWAPDTAPSGSRVPIELALRAVGATGRTLRAEVLSGAIVLDRATHAVVGDDERFSVRLSAPALAAAGLARFDVRVRDDARDDPALGAERAVATEIVRTRWKVLVADPRPSWASAFVRRALEADPRFDVASRVTTSRGIAVETSSAPALTDARALEPFSAIVVGAPDALTAPEVDALELFARRRGGAVILLMDRTTTGPLARISGAGSLRDVHGIERRKIAGEAGVMVATEFAVPEKLSPGVDVLATTGSGSNALPSVWRTPLGAGRVIVSGALDAWRYRAREENGFGRFWSAVVAEAAASAPPPVLVMPAARLVAPGTEMDVRVVVRRAQLSDPSRPAPTVDVRARLVGPVAGVAPEPIRLWPTAERGVFVAPVNVGARPGTYEVMVDALDDAGTAIGSASAQIIGGDAEHGAVEGSLAAWTTAHGGVVVSASRGSDAAASVRAHVAPQATLQRIHPMRSLWWLPVVVLALGGEWWLRRRRGER